VLFYRQYRCLVDPRKFLEAGNDRITQCASQLRQCLQVQASLDFHRGLGGEIQVDSIIMTREKSQSQVDLWIEEMAQVNLYRAFKIGQGPCMSQ
jgi:hypothetical protein